MKVALLGFGNIGSNFYKIIKEKYHWAQIEKILVRDPGKNRAIESGCRFISNYDEIVGDASIQTIVDATAGEGSIDYINKALAAGKNVVTANKLAVAEAGSEFISMARKKNVGFYFEACVGGGIPLINLFCENVRIHKIKKVIGILNGTTNYILTQMSDNGLEFSEALALAQQKGFAEPDPSFDLSGRDTAYKITILKDLLVDFPARAAELPCQGIDRITRADLDYARSINYQVKLVGYIENGDHGIDIGVRPVFLPEAHPLAKVKNEFNAVFFEGDPIGEIMLYGRGAGANPTCASLISDLLRIKRHDKPLFHEAYAPSCEKKNWISGEMKTESNYFRFTVLDVPGVISKITSAFEKYGISISSMRQDVSCEGKPVNVIFTTHESKSIKIPSMLEQIKKNKFVIEDPVCYKMNL